MLFFFDEILVYSPDITEHEAFGGDIQQGNELHANRNKCVIGHPRIQYLGHWLSSKGVEANGEKIRAMVNWPQPKDVTELRGLLGLTGYCGRFVRNYGDI